MTVDKDDISSSFNIQNMLDEMEEHAIRLIQDYRAQDPLTIEISRKLPYLPRIVIDELISIKDRLNEESRAALEQWQTDDHQRSLDTLAMYEQAMNAARSSFRASLPPNWNNPEIEFPDIGILEQLQLDEGMPLAWLPPNRLLQSLFKLKGREQRASLIEEEHSVILNACRVELERLEATPTQEWRTSAHEALLAMQDGHWRAGQALSAIALDTAVSKFVVNGRYSAGVQQIERKSKKPTPPGTLPNSFPSWDDPNINNPRASLVLYGIWGAFAYYDGKGGEPVPTRFTRHGTVHTMSPRQYTKANALIALMHLVALLCLLEEAHKSMLQANQDSGR